MNLVRLWLPSLAALALAGVVYSQGQLTSDPELVKLINAYRKANGLEPVKTLPALTQVAHAHLQDLIQNKPHEKTKNLHAWSDKGKWTPGIPGGQGKDSWTIMWRKPREIADYEGLGFELAYFGFGTKDTAKEAMDYWTKSPPNREVFLNQGRYQKDWKGIGAVKGKGFYLVWFGQ